MTDQTQLIIFFTITIVLGLWLHFPRRQVRRSVRIPVRVQRAARVEKVRLTTKTN